MSDTYCLWPYQASVNRLKSLKEQKILKIRINREGHSLFWLENASLRLCSRLVQQKQLQIMFPAILGLSSLLELSFQGTFGYTVLYFSY